MKNNLTNIKGFLLLTALFFIILLADITCVYLYYNHIESFIHHQPEITKADAAILFFGDYLNEGKELGPDSKQRAFEAVRLFKEGRAKSIICVGGYEYHNWSRRPHLMSRYIINHGVPAEKIYHDSLSYNTITNCHEALKIIQLHKFDTVIAVSSPLHVFRIAKELKYKHAVFTAYEYTFHHFYDYWILYKDIHSEWFSLFLSVVLRDNVRNQIVYTYNTVIQTVKNFL